jgi:hypothetical protein
VVARNPFTPTFGSSPPILAGREELVDLFAEALDHGPGAPGRATLYTGARGSGKTVMLNEAEDQARQRGWLVISETATAGLTDRLVRTHLPMLLAEHGPAKKRRTLSGLSAPAGLGSLNWDTAVEGAAPAPTLRSLIDELTELLAKRDTGLLITVDEIHRQLASELRELGATVQHAFREQREVAIAMAGLPAAISDLLADDVITFLRRADRHSLGAVPLPDVRQALREPIAAAGRQISAPALEAAAKATRGYPFLIQLVGYQIWRQHPGEREITATDVAEGVIAARRRMGTLVYEPALAEASDVDGAFLHAMARDEGASRIAVIAARLGVSANYANQYRQRLISAQLIRPAGRGQVDFAVPYLREHLRERATNADSY